MSKRLVHAVVAALVASTVWGMPASWTAMADAVPDQNISVDQFVDQHLDQQIGGLQDDLEGASQDLITAAVRLRISQLALVQAGAVLVQARAARAAAVQHDDDLAARLAFAQAELDEAQQGMLAEQSAEDSTSLTLGQLARETYVGDQMTGLSVALEATSPEEFSDRMAVAGVALRAQGGTIDRFSVVQADLRARTAALEAIRAQIVELKQQSEIVIAQRVAAEQAANVAETAVSALVADQSSQLAVIATMVAAEQQRLVGLQADQAQLEAALAARTVPDAAAAARRHAGDGWNPPASSGFLSYPAVGPITSGFGMRYHQILHLYRMHTGVDLGIECGTRILAAADGDVVSAGPAAGYGNRVVIDHGEVEGGDLATTYDELGSIVVHGGTVRRGQLIAYSRTTGPSTGCHLHFETLLNGRYVDPSGYL